jgi:hypothetical protein
MNVDVTMMLTSLPLLYATAPAPVAVAEDDGAGVLPPELRAWLVKLRLLEGVPFANLVVDTELLPEESIRWFYLDRRWTDALVQGALSVGTVNSDDRVQLASRYDQVRDELDTEERNVRRAPDKPRLGGAVEAVSGFILRSRAVSGWPGLHVRAFTSDPAEADDAKYLEDDANRMRLLRLERLAPAVLFCLFDGIPSVVHVEEPRQGVQFGFDMVPKAGGFEATLRPRSKATFDYLSGSPVSVPFRDGGAPGVVDIQDLERRLAKLPPTGAGDGLDSGEYALQLIRFPFRQVFGDPENVPIKTVFTPKLMYADLVKDHFIAMEDPT